MQFRNIAIIAHVDHGKTTLVDSLMQQSGAFRENQKITERALDSGDLERERGITILAKCTSVDWQGVRINIVDTPGHSDFGGEVERILSMVDGVLLLVDAAEGPMPQTKFVTAKALNLGIKPIVIINKVDRSDGRPYEVQNEVFDLFVALNANDEQLDFPTIFASAKNRWASSELNGLRENMDCIFEHIISCVSKPKIDLDNPFSMLATTLEFDPFLGRILIGRIESGTIKSKDPIHALDFEGKEVDLGKATKLIAFRNVKRVSVEKASSGDLIAIAGLTKASVADTICAPEVHIPIKAEPVDPPTLAVTFSVNSSPLAGEEGSKFTSRMIYDRLIREAEGNVAIQVSVSEIKDCFEVAGRGELQLGILIEQMRREGFELSISRPRVIFKDDLRSGKLMEPFEDIQIDVDEAFAGVVVESISCRKGKLLEIHPSGYGKVRLKFVAPARGLIGYHGDFLAETRGTGVMNRSYNSYGPYAGDIVSRRNGVLISNSRGKAVAYALAHLEERGFLFITSGVSVYEGMIIGEHSKSGDLIVNPMKAKQLTNIRASGNDDSIRLITPHSMSMEESIAYIDEDELVEVTPENIRLRKLYLDPHERKRKERVHMTRGEK